MAKAGDSTYANSRTLGFVVTLALILLAIGWVGLAGRLSREWAWFVILLLMTLFAVVAGLGITRKWRGILIDARCRMCLSRLQILVWTLVVLSALLAAVLTNVGETASPFAVEIPSQLWVLLGISTASAVGAPAVLGSKRHQRRDDGEMEKTKSRLMAQRHAAPDDQEKSVVLRNREMDDARWGELLKGDESGNAAAVDMGKLQMLFFTFVLVTGYSAALWNLFGEAGVITAFPEVDDGMNVLLGISHTGYLSNKAISHSKEAAGDPKPESSPE